MVPVLSPRAALLLMAASGFAGLGYQIVWTQQCALWLGHESAAVLAVITAFFGGLAIGASALGQRIESSSRPVWWYAGCELIIAFWSLVLVFGMASFSGWLVGITGAQPTPAVQWVVAFCGTFVMLLPATAAMGATLPAMERLTTNWRIETRSIAALYASNTFGAVMGVLATAFWLIPDHGLARTAGVCISLNVFCAVACLIFFRESSPAGLNQGTRSPTVRRGVLVQLTLTGLLGIGYEVLVVRVLSQVTEDTVYTFAMLLAVYLVGSALGATAYHRWHVRDVDATLLGDRLLCALAAACLVGTTSLWAAEQVKSLLIQGFGASMTSDIAAEAILALLAFGLPTLVMGAVFSHLSAQASMAGITFGRALGVNMLGATAAPLLFGLLVFPAFGPKLALLLISASYLAVTSARAWYTPMVWMPTVAVLSLAILAPALAFVEIPSGGHVVSYQEGILAAVSVVEDRDGVARLRINNRQQEGSSATRRVDGRQALLPLLLHPGPRRALFLGLGTGMTASAAAEDLSLQVDAVELLPEVIEASRYFTRAFSAGVPNPRLHLIAADARRFTRTSTDLYDVIVSDNFHPARSGSGSLYTVEHFAAVRGRLAQEGLFCQWLPLHQLDLNTLRSIVQSFIAVYPYGGALLASNSLETPVLGLIARGDDGRFDVGQVRARLAGARQQEMADFGIDDEFALLGSFVAGPKALRHFAGNAPANTDDRPIVAYRAPRITYVPDALPRERLFELLQEFSIGPHEMVTASSSDTWHRRLAAYREARYRFIESGLNVQPSSDVRDMLAQVREPLLAVLRISPDFRPAYDPLVRMAMSLAHIDAHSGRALLTELVHIQPTRPEAEQALRQINLQAPDND